MGFMIICDHDRIGHRLGYDLTGVILNCEYDLKTQLLILMPAIASNAHGQFHLHGSGCEGRLNVVWEARDTTLAVLRRLNPFFDLVCVEYNDSLLFIFLE